MYYIGWYTSDESQEPNISGKAFRQLMEACFNLSGHFTLTYGLWANRVDTMYKELKPYAVNEKSLHSWFGYYPLPSGEQSTPMVRILYPANGATRGIIERYFGNLWLDSKEKGRKQSLEDICFFSNGKLILGTVSHERICRVFPPDEAFKSLLRDVYPYWMESDDSSEQIDLRDYGIELS
jgi:hypothetical protein